jgi:RNA polymerase sigma-70 factor, ECF subfamily
MEKSEALDISGGFDRKGSQYERENHKFSSVYQSLKRPVFLLALSILRDNALAEDVMQQTFLNMMEHAGSVRPGTNEKALVMTIAHNLALNCLKKRGHEELGLDGYLENETGGETDMTGSADFTRALSQLDEQERAVVTLKAVCGFRHAQIAKIVGITTVDSRAKYSRALKKLKKHYLENGYTKG